MPRVDRDRRHVLVRQTAFRPAPAGAAVGALEDAAPRRDVDGRRRRRVEGDASRDLVEGRPRSAACQLRPPSVLLKSRFCFLRQPEGTCDCVDGRGARGTDRDQPSFTIESAPAPPAVRGLVQLLASRTPPSVETLRAAYTVAGARGSTARDVIRGLHRIDPPSSNSEAGVRPAPSAVLALEDTSRGARVDDFWGAGRDGDSVGGATVRSMGGPPSSTRGEGSGSGATGRARRVRLRSDSAPAGVIEAEVREACGKSDEQDGRPIPPPSATRTLPRFLDQRLDERIELPMRDGIAWSR